MTGSNHRIRAGFWNGVQVVGQGEGFPQPLSIGAESTVQDGHEPRSGCQFHQTLMPRQRIDWRGRGGQARLFEGDPAVTWVLSEVYNGIRAGGKAANDPVTRWAEIGGALGMDSGRCHAEEATRLSDCVSCL